MTGREYLTNVIDKDKAIKKQHGYIEALRSLLEPSGINTDSERVQSSSDLDKFGKIFAMIDEEEERLNKMRIDFVVFRFEAITAINQVETEKHRLILYEKYINYKSFKAIAEIMSYSYDYIVELHGKALIEFEEFNPSLFGEIPC